MRGAWRKGLAKAAPVPKSGGGGDASSARPNWDAIDVSPGNTTSRSLASQEKSESSGEQGRRIRERWRLRGTGYSVAVYVHPWAEEPKRLKQG